MTLEEAITCLPEGWFQAFGNQLYRELKDRLIELNQLFDYEVDDVKEKWGELRWYDNANDYKIDEIIDKYTYISRHTCILCGKESAEVMASMPLCKECLDKWRKDRL